MAGTHVVFLNWRDTRNPEGGGSEVYTERVAAELVRAGHRVTLFCAAHEDAPADETLESGVRVMRRGNRHTVYLWAALCYLTGRLGRPDVLVDVCNGVPFLSPLYARCPTIVVVHHVHREQWAGVVGSFCGRIGWWLESRAAPRVYRRCRYVTVSTATRDELVGLGVDPERITIVHNGLSEIRAEQVPRTAYPCLVVLGRLVPHKRVELALRALVALPRARLIVVGRGWWERALRERAAELGVADRTEFTGFVDERAKHRLLASAWVVLLPSLKEGWGLTIVEAGACGTPSIAFRDAGGVRDAILDGHTGLLADDFDDLVAHAGRLLADHGLRRRMGAEARAYAAGFTWSRAGRGMARVIREVLGDVPAGSQRVP